MKKLVLFVLGIILSSCALVEPSMFIVENNSDYTIAISVDNLGKTFSLKKNKSECVVATPGQIDLTIEIEQIGLTKKQTFKLDYLEKKMIKIDIEQ